MNERSWGRKSDLIRDKCLWVKIPMALLSCSFGQLYNLQVSCWPQLANAWGTYSLFHCSSQHLQKFFKTGMHILYVNDLFVPPQAYEVYSTYRQWDHSQGAPLSPGHVVITRLDIISLRIQGTSHNMIGFMHLIFTLLLTVSPVKYCV